MYKPFTVNRSFGRGPTFPYLGDNSKSWDDAQDAHLGGPGSIPVPWESTQRPLV